jgi:hypothetical protein
LWRGHRLSVYRSILASFLPLLCIRPILRQAHRLSIPRPSHPASSHLSQPPLLSLFSLSPSRISSQCSRLKHHWTAYLANVTRCLASIALRPSTSNASPHRHADLHLSCLPFRLHRPSPIAHHPSPIAHRPSTSNALACCHADSHLSHLPFCLHCPLPFDFECLSTPPC